MADMSVPVPLVEGNEDTLDVTRASANRCQPRPIGQMLLDVGRGVLIADLRQTSAAGLEPLQGSIVGRLRTLVRICRVRVVLVCASWGRPLWVSVFLPWACRARIFLVNVFLIYAFLAVVCMARFCLTRIRLVSFCLAGFWLIRLLRTRGPLVHGLPHGDGVFGARARLRARPAFTGAVAGVRRVAANWKVTVIGLVPAATQFGHAQVWAEICARQCDG